MKVVTLCGSMKFLRQMQEIARDLEVKQGYCVLTPVGDETNKPCQKEIEILSQAHLKRIEISDAIYIVNIGGYIGEAVSMELHFAQEHKKEIIYHEKLFGRTDK